jgi:hypothetical protein
MLLSDRGAVATESGGAGAEHGDHALVRVGVRKTVAAGSTLFQQSITA